MCLKRFKGKIPAKIGVKFAAASSQGGAEWQRLEINGIDGPTMSTGLTSLAELPAVAGILEVTTRPPSDRPGRSREKAAFAR